MAYTAKDANGNTYTIGSDRGTNFVNNAAAGSTMTGGDGSTWTKNSDGSVTISAQGTTFTMGGNSGGSSGIASGTPASRSINAPNGNLAVDNRISVPDVNDSGIFINPSATKTTYIDANGNRQTGYIINGTTYTDPYGQNRVGVGSRVTGGDGQEWIRTATRSQLYADYLKNNGITEVPIYGNYGNGAAGTGYVDANGYTYTDALLSQRVPTGTIVQTGNGAFVMTESGVGMPYSTYQQIQAILAQPRTTTQQPTQQQRQQSNSANMAMLQSGLDEVNAALEQSLAYNDTTYTAQLEQLRAQLQSQIDALNRQYQAMNRQLYVDYMNSRKNLPQALAAQGYTGGLTESSMIGLDTGYQGQLSENERSRLAGISDLEAGGTSNALELQIAQAQANQEAYQDAYSNRAALYAQMLQQQNLEDERAREDAQNLYAQQLQLAQLGANYGDYSGLNALGIDTSAATAAAGDYYAQLAARGYTDYTSAFAWLVQQGIGSTAADTIAKGYINSLGGGSGISTAAYSGGGYDNGGLTTAQIKQMQRALGVTADGLWGANSRAAAGGLSAAEAWQRYGSNGNTLSAQASNIADLITSGVLSNRNSIVREIDQLSSEEEQKYLYRLLGVQG